MHIFLHIPWCFPNVPSHSFILTCFMSFLSPNTPLPFLNLYFAKPPTSPDEITFGKMAFRENVRGIWKNSSYFRRLWNMEKFWALLLYNATQIVIFNESNRKNDSKGFRPDRNSTIEGNLQIRISIESLPMSFPNPVWPGSGWGHEGFNQIRSTSTRT